METIKSKRNYKCINCILIVQDHVKIDTTI